MSFINNLARTADWFQWKIPPLIAAGYAAIFLNDLPFSSDILDLPILIFSICMVGAYGYIINDIFDIEQDLAAGKKNTMVKLSPFMRFFWLGFCLLLGFAVFLLLNPTPLLLTLYAVNFLLPTLYSVPPIRWKERGILGVLADTSAAHMLPTLIITYSFTQHVPEAGIDSWLLVITMTLWAFFVGFRGIINHQLLDLEADLRIGVITFAGSKPRKNIRNIVLRFSYPAELIMLAVFASILTFKSLLLGITIGGFAFLELSKWWKEWHFSYFFPERPENERYLPYLDNEFYVAWLPLLLVIQLLFLSPLFATMLALHLLFFHRMLWMRFTVYSRILSLLR